MRKLLVGMLLMLPIVASANVFPDVYDGVNNVDAIEYVVSMKIVEGYPDGTFKPFNAVNRAEFTKILIGNLFSKSEIENCKSSPFADVNVNDWFLNYVCLAHKKGIVSGYDDFTFRPANQINFAEAAKIVAFAKNGGIAGNYESPWYKSSIEYLASKSAIPLSIESFEHKLTRDELAEIIYRLDVNYGGVSQSYLEIGDIETLNKYYNLLRYDLKSAYDMRGGNKPSYDKFVSDYERLESFSLYNLEKVGLSEYSFLVSLIEFNGNDYERNNYSVRMKVEGGKVNVLSSIKVDNVTYLRSSKLGVTAEAKFVGSSSVVYMNVGGKMMNIGLSSGGGLDAFNRVTEMKISNSGRYLYLSEAMYEGARSYIFDSVRAKLSDSFTGFGNSDFSNDEKKFIACMDLNYYGIGYAIFVDLPSMNFVDLTEGLNVSYCGKIDKVNGQIEFQVTNPYDGSVMNLKK